MKRIASLFLISSLMLLYTGCASNKTINGVEYNTYGVLDAADEKNPNIHYNVVWGNVVWGALLLPTIICPIYFWGFSMYEPTGPETGIPGQVVH